MEASMSQDMIVASAEVGSVEEAHEAEGRTRVPDAAVVARFGDWVDGRARELGLATSPCERLGSAALLLNFRFDAEEAMRRVYQEAKKAGLRVFDPGSRLEG
jgi:hypothetical protein